MVSQMKSGEKKKKILFSLMKRLPKTKKKGNMVIVGVTPIKRRISICGLIC